MKVKGNGQGKVLTANELKRLVSDGLVLDRDLFDIREAGRCLFAICLFTGCRISESLSLQVTDIKNKTITFRKSTTKGCLYSRREILVAKRFFDTNCPIFDDWTLNLISSVIAI